ncbi:hypothetical protein QL093DRAFT_2079721 [Fusarium oxysporum]|nr:hypothetical protein QL093DRAFT_2079721 [Fusarium oxysporum]
MPARRYYSSRIDLVIRACKLGINYIKGLVLGVDTSIGCGNNLSTNNKGQFFNRAKAEKGVNRVGNKEDIREDKTKDKEEEEEEEEEKGEDKEDNTEDKEEEEEEEEEGEDKEEDNNNKAERVLAVIIDNRLKENIQEESQQIIKLYN